LMKSSRKWRQCCETDLGFSGVSRPGHIVVAGDAQALTPEAHFPGTLQ
jgi:hypothetical protein